MKNTVTLVFWGIAGSLIVAALGAFFYWLALEPLSSVEERGVRMIAAAGVFMINRSLQILIVFSYSYIYVSGTRFSRNGMLVAGACFGLLLGIEHEIASAWIEKTLGMSFFS